ncbi:MAG: hypothetical protein KatS3mg115_0290 [Candidatus Poribacteria bacterium]|nr:MAG: hypothetical protein KatS3mg115_0290 [Candidatus Poribacteria bacterium]
MLFRFAPYLVFGASVAVASVVPPFRSSLIGNYDLGLFLYLAISSLVVLGIIMAGWASNSKYSLFGAMRAAAQIVSYEIPLGLAVLVVVLATGTLNPQRVVYDQAGGVHHWLIFRQPFLFISAFLYYISAIAEVNRTPFDLPEAESEIVAGFHTEYSGIRFAYFFMAEYTNMVIVSAIATTLFLGGWSGPIPGWDLLPGVVWFALKTVLLVFVMMWLRWTLPRVRVDQLMALCWKYFLPIGLVNVLGTGILELLAQEGVGLTIGGWRIGPNGIAWVVVPVLVALLGVYAFSGGPQPRPAAAPRRP